MIDFKHLRENEIKLIDYVEQENITRDDLKQYTDESIDYLLSLVDGLTDADIAFEPVDEEAHDPYAVEGEENIGWTLGHLIAHVTASSEEGAAHSSLLARGIPTKERPRYETPWKEMDSVKKVVQRLEESRRMRHAYLETWPDTPHLDVYRDVSPRFIERVGNMNAPAAFLFGLSHEVGHYDQMKEVREQALKARQEA